jgi:hypothetical protein
MPIDLRAIAFQEEAMVKTDLTAVDWLLASDEPWTRYRIYLDLLDLPPTAPQVLKVRAELLTHPQVETLTTAAATLPEKPIKRHNDASHPIYALSTLADFGLRHDDPGMAEIVNTILAHQSAEGPFQSVINIPTRFGGSGEDTWSWILCDAPTLLYALLQLGVEQERVQPAIDNLVSLVEENGWRCTAAPELGKFRGPGRKADPCPIANVYALKALSLPPGLLDSAAAGRGTEMLLSQWAHQSGRKMYLFGIGIQFRRLKYPFIWYDILHVVEVLSRFPFVHSDPRFREMLVTITDQADEEGRYTAGSMYRAWKGYSFADKKRPSPWLTFLVQRIQARVGTYESG